MTDKQPPAPVVKKRKIQPIFLGALGPTTSDFTSFTSVTESQQNPTDGAGTDVSTSSYPNQACAGTSLLVNSRLISRVNGRDLNGGDNQKMEPSNELADKSWATINGSGNSMNGSLLSVLNNSFDVERHKMLEQTLPQLPDLSTANSAKLWPLPQVCNLQSAVKVELPVPQLQKELEIRLKLGPLSHIDRVMVQNSPENKRTPKSAAIQAKFGRESKWSLTVPSPVVLLQANRKWIVSCHEDKSLNVIHTQNGRNVLTLRTDDVTALLELNEDICLALSTSAELQVWDLSKFISLLRASFRTLLLDHSTGQLKIVQAYASAKGVPVIVLSNGVAFIYSRSLSSWLSISVDQDFLGTRTPSMLQIAKAFPTGLMSVLSGAAKTFDKPMFTHIPRTPEMALANDERQLEMLLKLARELDSMEEFRLLTTVYIQMLMEGDKLMKICEFLTELKNESLDSNGTRFDTILNDLRPLAEKKGIDLTTLLTSRQIRMESQSKYLHTYTHFNAFT